MFRNFSFYRVVNNLLAPLKPDENVKSSELTSRQYMAYQIRLGYREILYILLKAVQS